MPPRMHIVRQEDYLEQCLKEKRNVELIVMEDLVGKRFLFWKS